MANILVCDDERSICEMLDISLRREGHRVETVQNGQAAKNKIDGALYDVIITDIKMPNVDGIEVLRHAHKVSPDSAVILITAVDDYEAAVEAVKAGGASDYIRKSPGLVDEIADDLPARGAALAVTIAQRSWRALELTKLALRAHRQDTTNFDTAAQALLFDSADKYERMTTFLERKKA